VGWACSLLRMNLRRSPAFLAGVPLRSGDALPGVAEVGDDLELGAEGTDVVSQGGELGDYSYDEPGADLVTSRRYCANSTPVTLGPVLPTDGSLLVPGVT
jgi:hypothetical protein